MLGIAWELPRKGGWGRILQWIPSVLYPEALSKRHSFQQILLERRFEQETLESPLDCKEIQPVHSKGDQPWDFFGRTDAKAETLVLWPPNAKS